MEHHFKVSATWKGASNGSGMLKTPGLESEISLPPAFHGSGVGTNPEDLILGAAAGCFLITLTFVLQREGIAYDRLDIESEGTVVMDPAPRLTSITHRPTVQLKDDSAEMQARLKGIFERTEAACLISKAIRNNVTVHIKSHHEV